MLLILEGFTTRSHEDFMNVTSVSDEKVIGRVMI